MACGVKTTIAGGVVVTCDNLGASDHAGQHSGLTRRTWVVYGFTARVWWSSADKVAYRRKAIVRGDFYEPVPAEDIEVPAGPQLANYRDEFSVPSTGLSEDWSADLMSMNVSASGVAIPRAIGQGGGVTCVATYKGGSDNGRTSTDNQRVRTRMVASGRSQATDMACGLMLRCGDVWNAGTRVELNTYTGKNSILMSLVNGTGTVRATGPAVPANSDIVFEAIGNVYRAFLNGSATPLLSWTDSTNIASIGSENRRAGIITQTNYPMFQRQYDSLGHEYFQLEDVA